MENRIEIITPWREMSQVIEDKIGEFKFAKTATIINYDGKDWEYISSGNMRDVFRSGNWVIKVPVNEGFESLTARNIAHNMIEADVYRLAPDWAKKYLAETRAIANGWIMQEYVRVESLPRCFEFDGRMKEIGFRITDNRPVIFDYDFWFHDYWKGEIDGNDYGYDFLKRFFAEADAMIEKHESEVRELSETIQQSKSKEARLSKSIEKRHERVKALERLIETTKEGIGEYTIVSAWIKPIEMGTKWNGKKKFAFEFTVPFSESFLSDEADEHIGNHIDEILLEFGFDQNNDWGAEWVARTETPIEGYRKAKL